jgi:hypothetical protein
LGWIAYAVLAYGLITWILPVPLTLLHELGHALPMLVLTPDRVVVRVGHQPARPVVAGALELRVRWLNSPRWAWFGYVEGEGGDDPSRARRIAILAGGPLVSALVLAALLMLAAFVPWPATILVWLPALAVAWQLFVTAVPMRYPRWFGPYAGRVSDGYRIVRLLRAA